MLQFLFRFYRLFISQIIHTLSGPGTGCKYIPTCSEYCEASLRDHGTFKGGIFAIKRLLKCHPFNNHAGWDPVPQVKEK